MMSPPKKGNGESWKTRFNDIPNDVLKEIYAKLASESFINYMNAKQTSKEFHKAANDMYVLQYVNVQEFEPIPWVRNDKAIKFLESCKDSGNPEALFKLGMVEFFNEKKEESGLQLLTKAAKKGHADLYVHDWQNAEKRQNKLSQKYGKKTLKVAKVNRRRQPVIAMEEEEIVHGT
ncbi:hypothetical protein Tsubulata_015246 [Turnera subulata]|uniref:At2g35280-like TPR domain-containing protein n=1 Tax=Turnera subulata TaxID=218843 RepID=A0A9Q0F828_9ROSI|nr:hypothetical protein Tsubulata_015246 [Turnera subulata]